MLSRSGTLGALALLAGASAQRDELPSCDMTDARTSMTNAVFPMDDTYAMDRQQFAWAMGDATVTSNLLHPELIVKCETDQDVVDAISYAKGCGYKISVRSGGHNYAGHSSCVAGDMCMQLDVSELNAQDPIQVDGTSVTLSASMTLDEVANNLLPHGLMVPVGICDKVGVGGHFQSSSIGFFSRAHGLGMDYVKSFRLAVAHGPILDVSEESHPEIYYAVLGGGPGSFGVVLDYTFEAISDADYPNSAYSVYFFPYTHENMVELGKVQVEMLAKEELSRDWLPGLTLSAPFRALQGHPAQFDHFIVLQGYWLGHDNGPMYGPEGNFQKYVQPFLNVAEPLSNLSGLAPAPAFTYPMPQSVAVKSIITNFEHPGFRYHIKGHKAGELWDENFLESYASYVDEMLTIPGVYLISQLIPGGGSAEANAGQNAYGFRNMKIMLDNWVWFPENSPAGFADEMADHINAFHDDNKQYFGETGRQAGETFMTPDTTAADGYDFEKTKTYKDFYSSQDNFKRVQEAKGMVDPCDLFKGPSTVPVANKDKKLCRIEY